MDGGLDAGDIACSNHGNESSTRGLKMVGYIACMVVYSCYTVYIVSNGDALRMVQLMSDQWYSTAEVAARYGVTRQAVVKWINSGLLSAERVSPSRRSDWKISLLALIDFDSRRERADASN